jgi:hypothetical protein
MGQGDDAVDYLQRRKFTEQFHGDKWPMVVSVERAGQCTFDRLSVTKLCFIQDKYGTDSLKLDLRLSQR